MYCKKYVNEINNFVFDVLNGEEGSLCRYCFTREAYNNLKENKEMDLEILDFYYKSNNFIKVDKYIENKNGKTEETKIPLAFFNLLWDRKLFNNRLKNDNYITGYKLNNENFSNKIISLYCNGNQRNFCTLLNRIQIYYLKENSLGNFMPIPAALKEDLEKNHIRLPFDIFLKCIKNCYENDFNNTFQNDDFKNIFSIIKKHQNYFKLFNNFQNFVKENYLDMYIDKNGKIKELFNREKGQMFPENYDDIVEYLRISNQLLQFRRFILEHKLIDILTKDKIEIILSNNKNLKEHKSKYKDVLESIDLDLLYEEKYKILKRLSVFPGHVYIFVLENKNDLLLYEKKIFECLDKASLMYSISGLNPPNFVKKLLENKKYINTEHSIETDYCTLWGQTWGSNFRNNSVNEKQFILIIGCKE